MGKKRKSRGRQKGQKGRGEMIQCCSCGKLVPRDKCKKLTRWVTLIEPTLGRELRQRGAYIPRVRVTKNYCISCAVHRHIINVRARDERKTEEMTEKAMKRRTPSLRYRGKYVERGKRKPKTDF